MRRRASDDGAPELHYEVSDLGASFGTTGRSWTHSRSKGNLKSYEHSKFIRKATSEYVDFTVPARPALDLHLATPKEFFSRMDMRWIGKAHSSRPMRVDRRIAGTALDRSDSRCLSRRRLFAEQVEGLRHSGGGKNRGTPEIMTMLQRISECINNSEA